MSTDEQSDTPLAGTVLVLPHKHSVYTQVRILREALQSDKIRVGFLLGAGCPSGIYQEDGTKYDPPLIPDVAGLTDRVRKSIEKEDETKAESDKLKWAWDKLCEACKEGGVNVPNIEHILSELRTLRARRGTSDVDGLNKDKLKVLDEKICDVIVDAVGKRLPGHRCSYHMLASWVGGLERVAPIEFFTTNYDLLLEEAFEFQRIPLFDGFVGSREPFFDLESIEQDLIPRRWSRLWKLHGSINWELQENGSVFRAQGQASAGKAMVFPSHLKYDQSRRMPYLAMIDRLRAFFRSGGHSQGGGPPVLVISGYSFADAHLNEEILDGLRGNPSAQCFTLTYTPLTESLAVKFASEQPNLTVLARDGAVIGTKAGQYDLSSSSNTEAETWISKEEASESHDSDSCEKVSCRLGDFHYFGLFLESLYGCRGYDFND